MLKKVTLVFFLALASSYAGAQEKWFNQKINDKVDVNFPIEAKKLNETSYGIRNNDGVVFLITTVDLLKVTGMTAKEFNEEVVKQKWAEEFMGGLAPTMPNYTFSAPKIVTFKSNPAYQTSGRDDKNKNTIYMNLVFIDGIVYNMSSIVPDGKETKTTDKFLKELYIRL
ncbi:MAG: hypothetical protein REI78_04865 [Pedobacter sp.]|nr:hypothetical protein [Pedobacter sp.]MDQ8052329.1 hypothetical protein [Pedobacter sp.]